MTSHRGSPCLFPLPFLAAALILGAPFLAQAGSTHIASAPFTPIEVPSLLVTPAPFSALTSLAGKASKRSVRGSRAGKPFTPAGKKEIDDANAAKNNGTNQCDGCGIEVVPAEKSQRGVTPPLNQRERDHIVPKSKGGDGSPSNGQILCRECNLEKSDSPP